ncbi:uncharacterized protein LOC126279053 isoform X2 [Schistocerca gregaria]|uniref:uncharacterized protein LOC126279053 isoform X2 n=1 Tax=Schistocerca gregaria TaxID=7010 RepID=UPI00211E709B|nr:uncharacterized protein LOC126279053 isoform X2 [Schistocerca gregaria]
MTHNGSCIYWLFTLVLYHVAAPDRTFSSKTVTSVQTAGKVAQKPKAARARCFQHWSVGGAPIRGPFATKPNAFKYTAIIQTGAVRCSGVVIASKWVLSSTQCFVEEDGVQISPKKRASKWPDLNMSASDTQEGDSSRRDLVQLPVVANTNFLGLAFAGGINYNDEADLEAEGVQQRRLERLLVYTETHTDEELRTHDVMLAKIGPTGFQFDDFVEPIHFTDQRRFTMAYPTTCIVIGFGGDNTEAISTVSLSEKCVDKTGADNIICVDEFGWPCMGDAGAPLVCRNLLVGTLRKEGLLPNDRCEADTVHTVNNFTFVGYYRDWIVEHVPVRFGVWRSRPRHSDASTTAGNRGASCALAILLDIWMFVHPK